MARTKNRARKSAPSTFRAHLERNTEQPPASPTPQKKPAKKGPRPTQTYIEVNTDDEVEEPRLNGTLRGLNPANMLVPTTTKRTTEASRGDGGRSSPDVFPKHETRASRHGKAQINYSMKYHPMDEVTRPKRARRATGSRSLSATISHRDEETSEESDLEAYRSEDSEDEDDDEEAELSSMPAERIPDPRATRHSARSEAQKSVNYSRSHHPQDHALPGFQHLAKKRKAGRNPQKNKKKRRALSSQTITANEAIDLSSVRAANSDGDDVDDDGAAFMGDNITVTSSPSKRQKPAGRHQPAKSDKALRVPSLPRAESSINRAEAILQGHHISNRQLGMGGGQQHGPSDDGSDALGETINQLFTSADCLAQSVETLGAPTSYPTNTASQDIVQHAEKFTHPSVHIPSSTLCMQASPDVRPDTALPTPTSLGPITNSRRALTQAGSSAFNAAVFRLSLTQEAPKVLPSATVDSSKTLPGGTGQCDKRYHCSGEADDEGARESDGHRLLHETEHDKLKQAMRLSSSQAAQVASARAKAIKPSPQENTADDLDRPSQRPDSHSTPRQISRDTLPDNEQPSSFFDDAMASGQDDLRRSYEDNLLRSLSNGSPGFSGLPVSQRERSESDPSGSYEPRALPTPRDNPAPEVEGSQGQRSDQDATDIFFPEGDDAHTDDALLASSGKQDTVLLDLSRREPSQPKTAEGASIDDHGPGGVSSIALGRAEDPKPGHSILTTSDDAY